MKVMSNGDASVYQQVSISGYIGIHHSQEIGHSFKN
jgi:hypothetical protein